MMTSHRHEPGEQLGNICRRTGEVLELCRCRQCAQMLVRVEGRKVWRTIADHARRYNYVRASLV